MANLTNGFENELLDGITGVTSLISSTMSLALFTADPTETGSVADEVSGGGYERLSLSGLFTAAVGTDGIALNTALASFVTATADWPTVTHVGIMKTAVESADDMVMKVNLPAAITILNAETFEFELGDLDITVG